MEWKYELGDQVKDSVTGYVGIIDCRSEYLNGCHRYSVQAPVSKDGKIPTGYNFDEIQLVLVKKKKLEHEPRKTGGPMTKSERW